MITGSFILLFYNLLGRSLLNFDEKLLLDCSSLRKLLYENYGAGVDPKMGGSATLLIFQGQHSLSLKSLLHLAFKVNSHFLEILLYFVFNCDNSMNCPNYFLKGESQEFMSETQCRIEYFYFQCTTIAAFIKT